VGLDSCGTTASLSLQVGQANWFVFRAHMCIEKNIALHMAKNLFRCLIGTNLYNMVQVMFTCCVLMIQTRFIHY